MRPDSAILLACWDVTDRHLVALDVNCTTTPVAARPMVQRAVERLVTAGCTRIAVVNGDHASDCEQLLGNGERFGVALDYLVAPDNARPLAALEKIIETAGPALYIASAMAIDDGTLCGAPNDVEMGNPEAPLPQAETRILCTERNDRLRWTGWGLLSSVQARELLLECTGEPDLESRILARRDLVQEICNTPLTLLSAEQTLESITTILRNGTPGGTISQRERSPGVWVGPGTSIHPGASLTPPIFIGRNVRIQEGARVGPDAVIESGCLIESGAVVASSWMLPDTYVGQELTLTEAIICGNRLVNVSIDVMLKVTNPLLLDGAGSEPEYARTPKPIERIIARVLWWLTLPLAALVRRRVGLTATPDAVEDRGVAFPNPMADGCRPAPTALIPSAQMVREGIPGALGIHFIRTFHPGLQDIWQNRVRFIGIEPRTVDEIQTLPPYWQRLYARAPVGLINDTLLLGELAADPDLGYAGDALAASGMSRWASFKVLLRYLRKVLTSSADSRHA